MDNQRQADEVKIIAGFFAGEGHIGIRKQNKKVKCHSLNVELGNTEKFWCDLLVQHFGGSLRVYFPKRYKNALPYYHWSLKDGKAYEFLRIIYPFLLGEKRQQAEIALELAAIKEGHTGHYTVEQCVVMERLANRLQELRRAVAETKRVSALPMRNDSPILEAIPAQFFG